MCHLLAGPEAPSCPLHYYTMYSTVKFANSLKVHIVLLYILVG